MRARVGFPGFLLMSWCATAIPLVAGAHTWDVNELFSNADGTIQFIELREMNGTPNEVNVGGHMITSSLNMFTIPENVASPTSNRMLLFATAGFAALPGAPTPDFIIADNFFSIDGDTIQYTPYDSLTFGSGDLPTDGLDSLGQDFATGPNTPTNYAGETGTIDVRESPPGVPATGPQPLRVSREDTVGTSLTLTFDTDSCSGNGDHQIFYGLRSDMPATPGGSFSMQAAVCSIGGSPFTWIGVPDPSETAARLLWILVVATDGSSTEGSWGLDGQGVERAGPLEDGSSGQCAIVAKNLSNTCGL
jgi:hypothetical protein